MQNGEVLTFGSCCFVGSFVILNDESRVDFLESFCGKFVEVMLTDMFDVDIVALIRVDLLEFDAIVESISFLRCPLRMVECR